MKKLFTLKVSLLISLPIFAEAIPESLQTLTPIQKHLYDLATPSKKQSSGNESSEKPIRALQGKIDSRFLPQKLKDLTQEQLKAFFQKTTLPENKKRLAEDPSLDKYQKTSTSISRTSPKSPVTFKETNISVINTDTVSATLSFLGKGSTNPAVLNLANKTVPGGGVQGGSKAQEEDVCRTTTLYISLSNAKAKGEYPLGTFEALYSPKVLAHQQPNLGSFAVITMAGYRAKAGSVDPADYPGSEEKFREGMKEKIRVIIDTAIANGHQDIILGAIGCGAFAQNAAGNVIEHIAPDVAKAFATVLKEKHLVSGVERTKHFRNIQFAILEDKTAPKLGNTFRKAFGIPPVPETPTAGSVPEFTTSIANVERLFKELSGLRAFFSGQKVTVKLIKQTLLADPKAALPVKVNSYSELNGGWTIHASFANEGHVAEVEITGNWRSLDKNARHWLKKVTKQ